MIGAVRRASIRSKMGGAGGISIRSTIEGVEGASIRLMMGGVEERQYVRWWRNWRSINTFDNRSHVKNVNTFNDGVSRRIDRPTMGVVRRTSIRPTMGWVGESICSMMGEQKEGQYVRRCKSGRSINTLDDRSSANNVNMFDDGTSGRIDMFDGGRAGGALIHSTIRVVRRTSIRSTMGWEGEVDTFDNARARSINTFGDRSSAKNVNRLNDGMNGRIDTFDNARVRGRRSRSSANAPPIGKHLLSLNVSILLPLLLRLNV